MINLFMACMATSVRRLRRAVKRKNRAQKCQDSSSIRIPLQEIRTDREFRYLAVHSDLYWKNRETTFPPHLSTFDLSAG
jgi:hypothetical protein